MGLGRGGEGARLMAAPPAREEVEVREAEGKLGGCCMTHSQGQGGARGEPEERNAGEQPPRDGSYEQGWWEREREAAGSVA